MNREEANDIVGGMCAEMRDDGMIIVEHKDGSSCRHTPICDDTTVQITKDGSRFYERHEQRIKHG